jgi:hypothetical protein
MLSQNSFLTGQLSAPCRFVGAMTGGADQTNRFIDEGLWEHDFDDNSRLLAQVRSMQTGEPKLHASTTTQNLITQLAPRKADLLHRMVHTYQ